MILIIHRLSSFLFKFIHPSVRMMIDLSKSIFSRYLYFARVATIFLSLFITSGWFWAYFAIYLVILKQFKKDPKKDEQKFHLNETFLPRI